MSVERIAADGHHAPLVLTCEHASNALPDGRPWPAEDVWLRQTHWAYDLGAAKLCRELAEATGAPAVLAGFSRLYADPNRRLDDPTFAPVECEGRAVELNRGIDNAEKVRRVERYHAYHDAVDETVGRSGAPVVLAVHSFTPVWQGRARAVELGVLFDREEELAARCAAALSPMVREVRLNEPYSGREGLIYSAHRHATAHGKRALEIEVRQDLCVDPSFRARLVGVLATFFSDTFGTLRG